MNTVKIGLTQPIEQLRRDLRKQENNSEVDFIAQVETTNVVDNLDVAIDTNADLILSNINKALMNVQTTTQSSSTGTDDALQKAIKDMGLRETFCKGVYCEQHNPNMPAGNWTHQRHYVWNEATQEMVQLKDSSGNELYYISSNGSQAANCQGLIQAYQQGYNFTAEDGVFEKGGEKYNFNAETNTFEKVENNNQDGEIEQSSHTTQTFKNDDGSYLVKEYDEIGVLFKSTEYDKDGKITHEWQQNEDGSYSDKFYTYENNALIQIQETIHYTDGNYTYIFTDENGNLKEEQKVIHNELGGLTFDATFGDGTRRVLVYNGDDNVESEIYYLKNGNVDKTLEYNYDAKNPNIYTVTTKNADGRITAEEKMEKYTFPSGGGSFLLSRKIYDSDGNIEYEENHTELEAINSVIDNLKINLLEAEDSLRNLQIPTPPQAADYTLENGEIDEDAYQKAYAEYDNACKLYDENVMALNHQISVIPEQIDVLETRKNKIEITDKTSKIADNLEQLKQSSIGNEEIIQDLENKLNKLQENSISKNENTLQLKTQLNSLYKQLTNLQVPTPPSASDYLLEDGSVDEEGYEKAFKQYENELYQYDKNAAELESKIATLNNELKKNELEMQKNQSDLVSLAKSVDNLLKIATYVSNIENQIAQLEQNGKSAEANSLKQAYQELKDRYIEIINAEDKIQQQIEELQEKILNLYVPTPPSTSDYLDDDGNVDEEKYSQAMAEYEHQCAQYDRQSNLYNYQMDKLISMVSKLDEELNEILVDIGELA